MWLLPGQPKKLVNKYLELDWVFHIWKLHCTFVVLQNDILLDKVSSTFLLSLYKDGEMLVRDHGDHGECK